MNFPTIRKKLIIPFTLLLLTQVSWAQDADPVVIGHKFEMESLVLEETRPFWVYTPPGYETSDDKYPVMYLLDGASNFHHTSSAVDFLSRMQRIPKMIVVGIPNTTDRTRDLTPEMHGTDQVRFPSAGKADNMIKFMETELIPQINRTYRTRPYRMLVGHSFGGLFAIHTMVNHPDIFDSYLAISPSLWWDNNSLIGQADEYFDKEMDLHGHLYMTMGNEGGGMLGGAWKLSAILKEKAPNGFTWEFVRMEEETHGSVPQKSTIDGLEYIFSDWYLPNHMMVFDAGGLSAIDAHFAKLEGQFGYAPKISEQDMNALGYRFLTSGNVDLAVDIFEWNTKAYPESSNVWDSYAEGLMNKGDKNKAVKYYKKSFEMDPSNQNAVVKLKELGVAEEEIEKKFKVSGKMLKEYTGTYTMDAGFNVLVELEGDKLYGHPEVGSKEELVPTSPHKFYVTNGNGQVEFITDGNGKVTGVIVDAGGEVFTGTKVEQK